MKIKKYFASDMRQALNLARQENGPDVVILGNRKVLGGVELIAADDYEESLYVTDAVVTELSSQPVSAEKVTEANSEIDVGSSKNSGRLPP